MQVTLIAVVGQGVNDACGHQKPSVQTVPHMQVHTAARSTSTFSAAHSRSCIASFTCACRENIWPTQSLPELEPTFQKNGRAYHSGEPAAVITPEAFTCRNVPAVSEFAKLKICHRGLALLGCLRKLL